MIELYEKLILDYMKTAVPTIKEATYAEKEDLFEVYSKKKVSPSFYFNRNGDLTLAKSITVESDDERTEEQQTNNTKSSTKFYTVPFNYKGYLMVEKQKEALALMAQLRFFWDENPYLAVPWPITQSETIPVALRLLYIKIEEIRSNKEDKGPLRCVEFSWDSQLFISKDTELKLINKIIVTVNQDYPKEFNLPNN